MSTSLVKMQLHPLTDLLSSQCQCLAQGGVTNYQNPVDSLSGDKPHSDRGHQGQSFPFPSMRLQGQFCFPEVHFSP